MIISESEIRVRFCETDAMRVVYHSNYFTWFEVSRVDMMDRLGMPYKELDAKGFHLPVLEVNAKYFKSAFFDDRITVRAMIKERPRAVVKIEYEVLRGNEKICEGFTRHAFVDNKGAPMRPPEEFLNKINKALEEYKSAPLK